MTTKDLLSLLVLALPVGALGYGFGFESASTEAPEPTQDPKRLVYHGDAFLTMNLTGTSLTEYLALNDQDKLTFKLAVRDRMIAELGIRNFNWTDVPIETDARGHKPEAEIVSDLLGAIRGDLGQDVDLMPNPIPECVIYDFKIVAWFPYSVSCEHCYVITVAGEPLVVTVPRFEDIEVPIKISLKWDSVWEPR